MIPNISIQLNLWKILLQENHSSSFTNVSMVSSKHDQHEVQSELPRNERNEEKIIESKEVSMGILT